MSTDLKEQENNRIQGSYDKQLDPQMRNKGNFFNQLGSMEREAAKNGAKGLLDANDRKGMGQLTSAALGSRESQTGNDQVGKGFTGSSKKEKEKTPKNVIAKRWGIGMLIAAVMGGGGFSLFSVASGPLEFVQLSHVLSSIHFGGNDEFSDNRVGKLLEWMRSRNAPERHNMGWLGNKFADHYEKKLKAAGITPEYERGRFKSLTIDLNTEAGKAAKQKLIESGTPPEVFIPGEDGKVRIAIDKGNIFTTTGKRQTTMKSMLQLLGISKINRAVGNQIMYRRGGILGRLSLEGVKRSADEKVRNWAREKYDASVTKKRVDAIKTQLKNYYKNGATALLNGAKSENTADEKNKAGADAANEKANEIADGASDIIDEAKGPGTVKERSARLKLKLGVGAGVGVTSMMATVCGVKALGDAVGDMRYQNITLPLMRMGMSAVTTGEQIENGLSASKAALQVGSGDALTAESMGDLSQAMGLYDEETKTSWADAASIQAGVGEKVTGPDMPDSAKPGNAEKPTFFQKLDQIIAAIPGGNGFCDLVNTTSGGIILSAAGILLASTGPVSLLINSAVAVGQYFLVGAFMDDLVAWLAGEPLSDAVAGATRGNYYSYGTRLAANDAAISTGGAEMSAEQAAAVDMNATQQQRAEHNLKPFYARYFDIHDPDSLVARVMFGNAAVIDARHDPQGTMASLVRMPLNMVSSLGSSFATIFSGKAMAAENGKKLYDYGFPKFGFTLQEEADDRFEDPYANADIVEPQLESLNEKYGECFNVTIDPTTYKLQSLTTVKRYDQLPAKCKDRGNLELSRYRFYIADMTNAKSMACYEGIDDTTCEELGWSTAQVSSNTSQSGATIDMAHLYDDSTSVACAANLAIKKPDGSPLLDASGKQVTLSTTEAPTPNNQGWWEGWHGGKTVHIKLCILPNMKSSSQESHGGFGSPYNGGMALVNSRASGAWLSLIANADAAGRILQANSSYRTMEHQKSLCPCNGVTVAHPGFSNHQMGLAIDVGNKDGDAISEGGSDGFFAWLRQNAESFGIKNYPKENWHWSPTGS